MPAGAQSLKSMLAEQSVQVRDQTLPPSQYLRATSVRRSKSSAPVAAHSTAPLPSSTSSPRPRLPAETLRPSLPQRATTAGAVGVTRRAVASAIGDAVLPTIVSQPAHQPPRSHRNNLPAYEGPYLQRLRSAPASSANAPSDINPEEHHITDPEIERAPSSVAVVVPVVADTRANPCPPLEPRPQHSGGAIRALGLSPPGVSHGDPTALTSALREVNRIVSAYETLHLPFSDAEQLELLELASNCGLLRSSKPLDLCTPTVQDDPRPLADSDAFTPPGDSQALSPPIEQWVVPRPSKLPTSQRDGRGVPDISIACLADSRSCRESITSLSVDITGVPLPLAHALADIDVREADAPRLLANLAVAYIPHCSSYEFFMLKHVGDVPLLVSPVSMSAIDLRRRDQTLPHVDEMRALLFDEPRRELHELEGGAILVRIDEQNQQPDGIAIIQRDVRASGSRSAANDDAYCRVVTDLLVAHTAAFMRMKRYVDTITREKAQSEAMLRMTHLLTLDALDYDRLLQDIMETVKQLTDADRCSIFQPEKAYAQAQGRSEDFVAVIEGGKVLRAPADGSIVGKVARSLQRERVDDVENCADFFRGADRSTGYRTKSLLCVPVLSEGELVAVAQLINKKPASIYGLTVERHFDAQDEHVLAAFGNFIGLSLRNCHRNNALVHEKTKVDKLFSAMTTILDSEIADMFAVSRAIAESAKRISGEGGGGVECAVFTTNPELSEFRCRIGNNDQTFQVSGVAGQVARSRRTCVLKGYRAISSSAFCVSVDAPTLDSTAKLGVEELVTIPIEYAEPTDGAALGSSTGSGRHDVLGVLQLFTTTSLNGSFNRPIRRVFDAETVELLSTFAMFAGVWLHHAALLEFTIKAGRAATKLSMGVMRSAAGRRDTIGRALTTLQQRSVTELMSFSLPSGLLERSTTPDFDIFAEIVHSSSHSSFSSSSSQHPQLMASRLAFELIMSTGLPDRMLCPPAVLAGYILGLREKYRSIPYHNFFHAVDVLQTVHTFLYHGKAEKMLSGLDRFTLLVTALAHDVDHMGLNNSFHLKTDSPLGILSSASGSVSVLEVHHCNITIEMMSCEAMNVFQGLSEEDSARAYRLLIDCVLATDMAKHKDLLDQVAAFQGPFDKSDTSQRRLLSIVLLKMADISNVTKPFEVSKKWAKAVVEEFHRQGDMEKEKGIDVLPMFDRTANLELAKGQIGFIDFVTKAFFGTVTESLVPQLRWVYERMLLNRERWADEQLRNMGSPLV